MLELSEDLAEFVGILVGDGGMYRTKTGGTNIEINSGYDDIKYMDYRVRYLIKKLFNKDLKVKYRNGRNEIRIVICSNAIGKFLNEVFSLPYGNKGNIDIPEIIKISDEKTRCAFIRGLFDTDFCFRTVRNDYPIIQADFKSSNLIVGLKYMLTNFGITSYTKLDSKRQSKNSIWITNRIQISGRKNLEKWMELIGSNNPKHLTKIYKCMSVVGFGPTTPSLEGQHSMKLFIN